MTMVISEPRSARESTLSVCFDHWRRHSGAWITAACLFIGLVSAYDAYLTMAYAPFLVQLEVNPIGRTIMRLDEGNFLQMQRIALFLGLKFAGTICAISVIHFLGHYQRRWASPVALSLAAFQVLLLIYLQFGVV